MTPRQIASWKRSELGTGGVWPVRGPDLPPGWLWVFTVHAQAHLAAAEGKPLAVRRRRAKWIAEVRGRLVREAPGGGLCTVRVARKGDRPTGVVYLFETPNDAAVVAETLLVEEDDHG